MPRPSPLFLLRINKRIKPLPPSLTLFSSQHQKHFLFPLLQHAKRTYATLNDQKTDQRDPDIPPGLPAEGLLSTLPTIEKTPDIQLPWFMNGPHMDMSKYKYPLRHQDGKETIQTVLLQIPFVENIVRFLLHSFTRFMVVKMANLLTYPDYLLAAFYPGAQHAARVLFKALSEKDRATLNEICTPQLYERLKQSLDRLDSQRSEAKLSIQTIYAMKLNDFWLKIGHPQLFLARPSRNLVVYRTMTITVGKMKSDDDASDENNEEESRSRRIPTSRTASLHQFTVDAQFIAHVTRSLTCLPANTDNPRIKNEAVSVLDDKGPREFILSFKSSPVPRRVGTGGNDDEEGYRTATELKWKISDIDYLLASEDHPEATIP